MNLQSSIDAALVLILLLDLGLLASSRLKTCIRIFAVQCLILSLIPLAAELMHGEGLTSHAFILLAGTIALKVILIPWVLQRTIQSGEIQREIEPFIGFTASIVIGAVMIAGCFAIGMRLRLPGDPRGPMSQLLVPTALSTLLMGLLVLISRIKAITQVIGYLVVENGIYLFGLTLLKQMPLMIELGILLDIFVGVFVMAIVVYHIRREFDHMDTHVLDQLKEN